MMMMMMMMMMMADFMGVRERFCETEERKVKAT